MKGNIMTVLIAAIVVAVVVVVEESRIAKLEKRFEAQVDGTSAIARSESGEGLAGSRVIGQPSSKSERTAQESPAKRAEDSPLGEFGRTMRKMADNPAAKAMFAQGHKGAVLSMYGALIDEMDFTEEEEDYFITLLAGEFADQQKMGMKIMGAQTDEEREAIFKELTASGEERKNAIEEFLNDGDDHKKYDDYHARLAEHQQLPGIKAAMNAVGADLRPEQESQLVEAMYEARTETNPGSGQNDIAEFRKMQDEDAVANFENEWQKGQDNLRTKLDGILDEAQMKAFSESQEQMKEFQLMGIKMMQGMMKRNEN